MLFILLYETDLAAILPLLQAYETDADGMLQYFRRHEANHAVILPI